VTPDVVLKIFMVEPADRILDPDTGGDLTVRLRFNKGIDQWPANRQHFAVLGPDNHALPSAVAISGNDALITIQPDHGLAAGDGFTVLAGAGIAAVQEDVVLYTLDQDQSFALILRDAASDKLALEAAVPRRIQRDTGARLTVSGYGIPTDIAKVRVFVSDVAVKDIVDIQSDAATEGLAVIWLDIPPLPVAGQFDITVMAQKGGIWQTATLAGGLLVDAPVELTALTPAWGPVGGSTLVTVHGRGFEPGTTVMEGLDIRVGGIAAANIQVLSSERLQFVTRSGRVGRNDVIVTDRYGNAARLTGAAGFGFGLRQVAGQRVGFYPSDIHVDPRTGIAVTNGGYFYQGHSDRLCQETLWPDNYRAAAFDVQASQPLLVGGAAAFPDCAAEDGLIRRYLEYVDLRAKQSWGELPVAEQARLEALEGVELARALDSIQVLPVQERDADGGSHRRLYVAGGSGGVARLNLDDANGMQLLSQVLDDSTWSHVVAIAKAGHTVFAARAHIDLAELPVAIPPPCQRFLTKPVSRRTVERISYLVPEDPVYMGEMTDGDANAIMGGNVLRLDGDWLFAAGQRQASYWNPSEPCGFIRLLSASAPADDGSDAVRAVNIYDRARHREYQLDANVQDLVTYGDYLIAAVGGHGLQILHRELNTLVAEINLDQDLQANPGRAVKLQRMANLLLVSAAQGGIIAVDLTDPRQPAILSAGNMEAVEGVDVFKDRLVAVAADAGIATFELPGALVQQTGVAQGGYLAADEDYTVAFNEQVELAADDITVTNLDTGEPVTPRVITLKARAQLDGSGQDLKDPASGPSDRFAVRFDRIPQAAYEIRILAARNQRGGGLWLPFAGRVKAASDEARRPVIRTVDGGGMLGPSYQDVIIHGSGFSNSDTLRVYIDHYELTPRWVDEQTLILKGTADPDNPAGSSIDGLPLTAGEHHLRVVDRELWAGFPGAIVIAEDPQQVQFQLSPESAGIHGNRYVTIRANRPAILPGARVIMRSRAGAEIRTTHNPEGDTLVDLKDDVRDLQTLRFWLPPVDQADIYTVALAMGGREVDIGHFSYSPGAGRTIDLPNYPPLKIGALEKRGNLLFAGVKGGKQPTSDNRFLMPAGLEIYDIAIWDRPVRLAQIRTAQAVTGVAVFDNAAYLAAGSDGLLLVDIANPQRPQVIGNFGMPGNQATDVALNRKRMVLAAAAADAAGGGFIRFYDVADPELDPPTGFSTLDLGSSAAAGRPVDIAWFEDRLFVLLNRGGQLYLAIFDQFDGTQPAGVQVIERGAAAGDLTDASLMVQHGQVVVFTGSEYLILRPADAGTYRTDYWQSAEDSAAALALHQGGLLMSVAQGLTDVPAPDLAVASIQPQFGAGLAPGETIAIWFNQPINTDTEFLTPRVQLWTDPATTLAPANYTLEAENYLAGAVVRLTLGPDLGGVASLTLTIAETITSYQDNRPLAAAIQGDYPILAGRRPKIQGVSRLMDHTPGLHYFHGYASEVVRVAGADFGEDKAELQIYVGDHPVASDHILAAADNEIRFQMPDLNLGLATTMLSLKVIRNSVPAVLNGALVIQPPVILQTVDPPMGPPQGGNTVTLYGLGFSQDVIVRFGDVTAGDLRVRSSSRVEVRAPAGSFGFVPVSVESRFFPDEKSSLPDSYFYAGRETGQVALAGEGLNSSPVAAIAVKDQVLYAVTGGSYDPVDREGRRLPTQTATTGRLVLSDISDPVHPAIIEKELAGAWQPFHDEQNHGFRDITLSGADLLAVGSTKLYHYDVTLPADPLYLSHYNLPGQAFGVEVSDGLVYVATGAGIQVYRLMPDRRLRPSALVAADRLGGQPGHLAVVQDKLWVALPHNAQVVALDLMAGDFALAHEVAAVDVNGNPYQPAFLAVHDDLLLASSGPAGTVVAYAIRPDQDSYPVAQLPLAYLISNGDVHAGAMLHQGQTLYVAAGDGDIQLFDISAWLDGNFREPVILKKYFAAPGAVRSIALSRGVMYAGSAYVYVDGQPAENPLEVDAVPTSAGGALSTLTGGGLNILTQIPPPRGWLARDQAIEIQFNRILDQGQLTELAQSLFSVQRSGVPVAVYASHQINALGSRIFLRPVAPWVDQAEYSVSVSAAVTDIQGNILGRDYRFRCAAADNVRPQIDRIEPPLGSWRGGQRSNDLRQPFQ